MPVNPVLRATQVGHILRDCRVRVLVTTAERLRLAQDGARHLRSVEHVVLVGDEAPAPTPAYGP